jgi:hypothetical protein
MLGHLSPGDDQFHDLGRAVADLQAQQVTEPLFER